MPSSRCDSHPIVQKCFKSYFDAALLQNSRAGGSATLGSRACSGKGGATCCWFGAFGGAGGGVGTAARSTTAFGTTAAGPSNQSLAVVGTPGFRIAAC